MNLKPNRKFKPNYEIARGRGTRGNYNLLKLIVEASPILDSDSMIELIKPHYKGFEVEVLEAITTYSSLYSGRTRPQLQMQTFKLNFKTRDQTT
ncbi:hypothetical protein GIB67_010263 [Kingdonia uniflora]|uniref:Uncharacterized protein n=1 Tax=Kingdonia uniflora TaxID=39325 RepID=A0A7J7NB23_9MAGN|nr:hypothetical protein GIB67_010263 [Kingdonia uniflora]